MGRDKSERIYKIAYITADWNRELVTVALSSLMDYLEAHDNIRAQVFNCFGFAIHTDSPSFRYKIYDLVDFHNYDAAIIQSHQIRDQFALKSLEDKIAEAGIPAISIGTHMRGCAHIGTDDYSASRDMAEHVIEVHGCRSFLYIKGAERGAYGEAYDRRRAFEDACLAHGIPLTQVTYYDGRWESERGAQAVRELLTSGRALPDAIISANDEMALGAIKALQEAGKKVPEDVIVTGFDDIFSASLSDPRLSTIRRGFYEIIQTACETVMRKLRGEETSDSIFQQHEPVFSESCGCPGHTRSELHQLKRVFYDTQRKLGNFYELQDKLTAGLFSAKDAIEIIDIMERCYRIFGSPRMYIYVNDYYIDAFAPSGSSESVQSGEFSNRFVLSACGGLDMIHDELHNYMCVSRRNMSELPLIKEETFSIFYPLHFAGTMIGFMVLTKPPTVTEINLHENIVNLFVFAMENIRQKLLAARLNNRLAALSVTDPLTGLYNRFGYEKYASELFGGAGEDGKRLRVLFLDIDDMKHINDRYGHECGDLAIRKLSQVISDSCRKSDFKMRYGGDEFVIITEACDADIKGRIESNLRRVNGEKQLPFQLNVSVGDYVSGSIDGQTLDDLLTKADELMYREKTQRKAMRGGAGT